MKEDILIRFGQKVREIRLEQKISQEELSFRSNLHRTYIGAVERGEKNISLRNMDKIAKALNVNLNILL